MGEGFRFVGTVDLLFALLLSGVAGLVVPLSHSEFHHKDTKARRENQIPEREPSQFLCVFVPWW